MLKQAKTSIFLYSYGLSDKKILTLLDQKYREGVSISVFLDPKNLSRSLKKRPYIYPKKEKGLMHKKILIIDQKQIFLGSANLTYSSLRMHHNLMIGLYHKEFARALQAECSYFQGEVEGHLFEYFSLPSSRKLCLTTLKNVLMSAKKNITLCMFTFTHQELAELLIKKGKELDLRMILDRSLSHGVSKKLTCLLQEEGIVPLLPQGLPLMHHKFAWIDQNILVFGSANWTKSAFNKNSDFIFIVYNLNKNINKKVNNIINNI